MEAPERKLSSSKDNIEELQKEADKLSNENVQNKLKNELIELKENQKDKENKLIEIEGSLKLSLSDLDDKKDENIRLKKELEEIKETKLMFDKKYELQNKDFKEYKNESRTKQKDLLETVAGYND